MPEAVIVATARSPIGRADKGSLVTSARTTWPCRWFAPPWTRCPSSTRTSIDDLMMGCGQPGGESGFNIGRTVAVAARLRLPARHHGQPLLLVVAADHPDGLPRHQGRRGLRRSSPPASRRCRASPRAAPTAGRTPSNPLYAEAQARTAKVAESGADGVARPARGRHVPDVYIAMGQTAENVALLKDVSREDMDHFGVRSQNLAEQAIADGFWQRDITPVTLPDGTVSTRTTARAPASRSRRSPRSSRSSAPTAGSPPATAARSTTAPPPWSS